MTPWSEQARRSRAPVGASQPTSRSASSMTARFWSEGGKAWSTTTAIGSPSRSKDWSMSWLAAASRSSSEGENRCVKAWTTRRCARRSSYSIESGVVRRLLYLGQLAVADGFLVGDEPQEPEQAVPVPRRRADPGQDVQLGVGGYPQSSPGARGSRSCGTSSSARATWNGGGSSPAARRRWGRAGGSRPPGVARGPRAELPRRRELTAGRRATADLRPLAAFLQLPRPTCRLWVSRI